MASLWALKKGRVQQHIKLVITAASLLGVFLTGYATRVALAGFTRYQGTGAMRTAYWSLHVVHMLLAITALPLIVFTLYQGYKGRIPEHRKTARLTAWLWSLTALTSIPVYFLLFW